MWQRIDERRPLSLLNRVTVAVISAYYPVSRLNIAEDRGQKASLADDEPGYHGYNISLLSSK